MRREFFPDVFKAVVDQVRLEYDRSNNLLPNFMFGSYSDLVEKCKISDNNQVDKYPLVWLVWDNIDDTQKWIDPYIYSVSAHVFILTSTDQDDNTEQKFDNVFEPILYPLFYCLVEYLKYAPNVEFQAGYEYPVTEHPFWSQGSGSFDFLSALEINFQKLTIFKD